MTDTPRRPILSLKFPPKPKAAPVAPVRWKCKPCGATVTITGAEAPDQDIRCPACNARLGLASSFLADPPLVEKIRARRLPG